MDNHRSRTIIIKLQARLTVDDRKTLCIFLGDDVPRRIRDDPSLDDTLSLIEFHLDQDKINEEDLPFLINAFDEIQCTDAGKVLREHMKRIVLDGFGQSVRSLSFILPPLLSDILFDQDDKLATETPLVDQTSIYGDNNTIISHKNINNNSVPTRVNNQTNSNSPLEQKESLRTLKMSQKCLILFVLLMIILTAVFVGSSRWLFNLRMKHRNVINEETKENERECPSSFINNDSTWKQHGIIVVGGNLYGNHLNQLSFSMGIYVDDDKQFVYIADKNNHRIIKWKYYGKNGEVVAGAKGKGREIDELSWPTDVIVDKKNNSLIICDSGNHRVMRWSLQNNQSQQIIISDISCSRLTMDNNGDLYVSDHEKNEVRRWKIGDRNGTLVAGGNERGNNLNQLVKPSYIFVDQDYSVYVSDSWNDRVMKWMKGAKEGIVVAGGQGQGKSLKQLFYPQGVIVDHLGNVYVADSGNDRIIRWLKGSKQGNIIVGGNGGGYRSNKLGHPTGLSFDRKGNIYVANHLGQRVIKFLINCKTIE